MNSSPFAAASRRITSNSPLTTARLAFSTAERVRVARGILVGVEFGSKE